MIKSRIKSVTAVFIAIVLTAVPMLSINADARNVEYSASSSYMSSEFYKALCKVELTGDQVTDICNIAKSQVGYHESSSRSDLSGYSSGGGNCTEYGRWYGMQSYWCNVFVSWCAYVAGVPASVFPKLTSASSSYSSLLPSVGADCFRFGSKAVEAGDLIFSCTCSGGYGCVDHVGLIVGVDDDYIYTVEGNMSDEVKALQYPVSSGYASSNRARINYVARPNYQDRSADIKDIGRADAIMSTEDSIYALYDISLGFNEAQKVCALMGGHLLTITSEDEQEAVKEILQNGSFERYYIGLTDEENGEYSWDNGEFYDYTNLQSSPNGKFSNVVIGTEGEWEETVENKRKTGFICEIDIEKVMPSNTASFGGNRYEIYDSSLTYEQASSFAKAKGGKLAQINDEAENQLLSILLKGCDQYYIGESGTKRELLGADFGNYAKKVKFNGGKENYAVMLNDGSARWSVCGIFETHSANGFIVEYSEDSKCTVTYDVNGGKNTPIEQMSENGSEILVSETIPELKGRVFLGWSENKDAQKADYLGGEKFSVTEDTTLYAI